jgi:quercetin dioxygenase-like cupin family protein
MLPKINRGLQHSNKGNAGIRPRKGFFKMTRAGGSIVVFFAAATWIGVAPTLAQDAKTYRTTLQEAAVLSTGYRATAMKIVIDEGGEAPWHTHPGPELGYIVSGEATFYFKDRPPVVVREGGSFLVPGDVVHHASNTGKGPLTVISTAVHEADKPATIPFE